MPEDSKNGPEGVMRSIDASYSVDPVAQSFLMFRTWKTPQR